MHPNEIDMLRIGKEGRRQLGEEARRLGPAYVEAFNIQLHRQAELLIQPKSAA